ncbi:DEHA2A13816p [Debaryomyces hansenii CBS767]|uniref:DEHA2A13816p n=1 Tax=Debaryomyces hansenii (strain ATCC 36239 / CBS 767 / BCRC 21394 / JCM 1990 / NBRC 0083 / IGC 2968) TaxID=284592 RepID=Q6BXY9_DEBHA|nr:DEHA2A13816p [Debaryomyces hansenii CBS767]CAG84908.2 DEHA2A13816p [Debaryomyces hansenii CBS767]|eukprot:XP_456930.2 DEHA2A13816p [Debaryomyces hansenii CBS767]
MANDYIQLDGINCHPSTHKFRALVTDLASVVQNEEEIITYIASYQVNIYVGTSLGQILHYHHFEDASDYILISQLQISQDKKPVKKILILPHIERALVLCGEIASVYSVPELSPSHIGKLKKIVDLSYFSNHSPLKNSEIRPSIENEEVLTLTDDKIRVIQVSKESIKLIKDISYSNAIKCVAFSSLNMSDHGSLAVVANEKNYDIIDLKKTRKVPLFDYHPNANDDMYPQIVPFFPNDDETDEEILLTIKSDESTSMSMFINSSGDITRGTLLWPSGEHPSGGVSIEWPYVFAICKSNNLKSKMIVASLKSFETESSYYIQDLLNISEGEKDSREVVTDSAEITNQEANTVEPIMETLPKESSADDVPPQTASNIKDDDTDKNSEGYKILKVYQNIECNDDELSNLLSKTDIKDGSIMNSNSKYNIGSTTLVYKESSIWMMYEINQIITLTKKIREISLGTSLNLEEIKNISKSLEAIIPKYTCELHDYSIQFLFLLYTSEGNYNQCMELSFQKVKDGTNKASELSLDPRFVIFAIDSIQPNDPLLSNFQIFTGLTDISEHLFDRHVQNGLLIDYLEKLYTEYLVDGDDTDEDLLKYCRMKLYQEKLTSSKLLIDFINHHDKEIWKIQSLNNDDILNLVKNSKNYFGLLQIYLTLVDNSEEHFKEEISKEICDICLRLLDEELSDPDVTKPLGSEVHFNDVSFNLQEIILSQLKENVKNDNTYSKYLLEVLKFNPSVGLSFMKANNDTQKATHKRIIEEMSESFSNEIDFSQLRLEYMESSFLEALEIELDLEALDEFLVELTKGIVSKLEDSNKFNFNILQQTYQIENSLSDSKWPKISWPDYLRISMKRSECQQFIDVYLKILELLIIRTRNRDSQYTSTISKFEEIISVENIFSYFKSIYSKQEDSLVGLLEFSDYSSAEYVALYGEFPLPVSACYFRNSKYITSNNRSSYKHKKNNLVNIFQFYIKRECDDHQHFPAIQHFISTYGILFTVGEVLAMVPIHFPIIYLQDYLRNVIINIDADHRDTGLKKILSKVDAKFTKDLCNDLTPEEQ